jgi:hypothetical protein
LKNTEKVNTAKFKVGDPVIFHNWLGIIKSIAEEYNSYTKATLHLYIVDWITTENNKQHIYPEGFGFREGNIEKWHGKYRERILKKDRG